MTRVFILGFALLISVQAASRAGEMDFLALRGDGGRPAGLRVNAFIPAAAAGVPSAPGSEGGSARALPVPPVIGAMRIPLFSWKNVCARAIGADAGLDIPDQCPNDFSTTPLYLGRKKEEGGGMFGYFLPKW